MPPAHPSDFEGRHAVDELEAETCMLGHFRMLPRVPGHLEAQWARAMADGFDAVVEAHRNVAAEVPGAAEDLDRALKWQLVLPQLLLRAPPRGGARGDAMVDSRFALYAEGRWRELVRLLKLDLGDTGKQRQRHKGGGQTKEQAVTRAIELIRRGNISKARTLLEGSGMGDVSDPRIQEQLRAKNPQTRVDWDPAIDYGNAPRMSVDVRETWRLADPDSGVGPDGIPSTYYSVLARRQFLDTAAASAIPAANRFAQLVLNDDLPHWYYLLYTAALQHAPIKEEPPLGSNAAPDVRPVLAGNMLRRLVTRAARERYGDVICDVCEPVQLAAGTKGIGQKLAIGAQLSVELFPWHVFVVIDWRNAYNVVHRARVIKVINSTPSARVWLRAYNSHTAPMSPIYYRGENGLVKNDYASVTGGQQGDLMGGDGYCLATLEDNQWLDAELAKHGGSFRAGMDDGLLHGPAEAVWPLIAEYTARMKRSCGLEVTVRKCKCFSPNGRYGARPAGFPIGEIKRWVQGPDGTETEEVAGQGVVLWGSPVGDSGFVKQVLTEKSDEIRSLISTNKTALVSRDPDCFLQVLRQSLCHRWDYWQQTLPPRLTVEFSLLIDAELDAAMAAALRFDPFDPTAPYRSVDRMASVDFTSRRARLPCRLRGLGQRSHVDVGPAAWVGAVNIAVPSFIARASARGGRSPGLFEHLTPLIGEGSFDEDRDDFRFRGFIAAGSAVSVDFLLAWQMMAAEPSLDPSGPLARGPESCGHGEYSEQLQRALTKHREEARFRLLRDEAKLLPASDHRRVAFTNCDSMAATWITACPSQADTIPPDLLPLVAATYLGVEVPTIRHLEGRRIGAEGKPVDPWGVELGLHRGGNCWTWRHDALKNMVAADIAAAGLDCLVEVISLFAPHIPPAAYAAARKVPPKRRRGLVPDGALRGWGHGSPEARPGWQMFEVKTLNVNLNASNAYSAGSLAAGGDLRRGADTREAQVPSEYRRKADRFDRRFCGTQPGSVGPLRRALDGFPEVRPLVFGGYGECSEGVRRLINALAFETASRRQRREDFDCLNVKQAQGVVAWWITRRWGRMALLTAAQVKEHALTFVGGSEQAYRDARARVPPPDGAADAFWAHRRTARDGGSYAGRGFGGFGPRA